MFYFLTLIRVSGVSVAPVAVDAVGNLLWGRRQLPPIIWLVHITTLFSETLNWVICSPLCNFCSNGGSDFDLLKPPDDVSITIGISLQWSIKVSISSWYCLIESWKWLWSFYRKWFENNLWCVPDFCSFIPESLFNFIQFCFNFTKHSVHGGMC